jgi:hypothetical protein
MAAISFSQFLVKVWQAFDHFSEAFYSPQIPHACRGLRKSERLSDLLVVELLIMPHQDHFAITIAEMLDRQLDMPCQFALSCRSGRSKGCVPKLVRQLHGGLVRLVLTTPHRLLPIDAPFGRQAVAAMSIDNPILGDLPYPKVERNRRVIDVIHEPTIGLDQNVLHDIAYVEPLHDSLIESDCNHPTQGVTVPAEEFLDRVLLSLADIHKKFGSGIAVRPNGFCHAPSVFSFNQLFLYS